MKSSKRRSFGSTKMKLIWLFGIQHGQIMNQFSGEKIFPKNWIEYCPQFKVIFCHHLHHQIFLNTRMNMVKITKRKPTPKHFSLSIQSNVYHNQVSVQTTLTSRCQSFLFLSPLGGSLSDSKVKTWLSLRSSGNDTSTHIGIHLSLIFSFHGTFISLSFSLLSVHLFHPWA